MRCWSWPREPAIVLLALAQESEKGIYRAISTAASTASPNFSHGMQLVTRENKGDKPLKSPSETNYRWTPKVRVSSLNEPPQKIANELRAFYTFKTTDLTSV
jgi:hypothetical protein